MGTQLRIIIILGIGIALSVIISMIKKEKLELKYSLVWILAATAIMLMAVMPKSIDYMASILNIANPINALFFVGMVFILIILFSLTVAQSRNSKKLKDLVQKVGMLEHKLDRRVLDKQVEKGE